MGLQILPLLALTLPPLALDGVPPTLDEIEWQHSISAAEKVAKKEHRPVLVYFWLEGSSFCQKMYGETLTTQAGAAELAHFVCLSVQADRAEGRQLVQRFGVSTLPTLVFLDEHGNAEDAIEGFIALEGFLAESQRIRRGEKTVSDWRRRAKEAPEDLDVRLRLALQLQHVGHADEGGRLLTSIKRDDPEGHTVAGAQLWLYDVFAEVRNAASDPSDSGTYNLEPLYKHMPQVKPLPVLYEGWTWIADVEKQRGDRTKERAALAEIWKAAEGEKRVNAGANLLQRYFQMEDELSSKERRLAKKVVDYIEGEVQKIEGFSKFDQLHHVRALGLAIEGKRAEALSEAKKAVEIAPDNPEHQKLRDLLQAERD